MLRLCGLFIIIKSLLALKFIQKINVEQIFISYACTYVSTLSASGLSFVRLGV